MGTLRAVVAFAALAALVSCELLVNTNGLSETDASAPIDGSHADGRVSDGGSSEGSMPGDSSDRKTTDAIARDAPSGDAPCPGEAGPKMVRVGSYCIDSTEVTGADYAAFVATDAGGSFAPPACAWKQGDYQNPGGIINGADGPAGDVDWCDAYVYCKWAGKRLCGAIGGGSVPFAEYADAVVDQWFAACGGTKHLAYPYGNAFDEDKCNGLLADGGYPGGASTYTIVAVTDNPGCVGGYPGIYDMSGNAAEWEDSCDESGGGDAAAQPCHYRGGSAHSDSTQLACAYPFSFGNPQPRRYQTDDLGFRCCAP
jgi:formylglycine-generating enzyme